ncbi:hypothetical protein vBRpoSV10_217 [Ruegeria phage vB_RpoS-V10]|nr:hypothetical protein DSS3P8_212 [Roseobacter phage DSS3P8]AWY09339.1 hypothetical protein vBRpoSV10_217 [Ruegeria phage vB_RpoS-V10]
MKIFRFYPADFKRMYFVAETREAALGMRDALFELYSKEEIETYCWDDETLEEHRTEKRPVFDAGFDEMEEHELGFLDTHY